jgi:hypothetical protein
MLSSQQTRCRSVQRQDDNVAPPLLRLFPSMTISVWLAVLFCSALLSSDSVSACGSPYSYVNGSWVLVTPASTLPLDTSEACANSTNYIPTGPTFNNGAYYGQPGIIAGVNASGSTACCPAQLPGFGSGPCCVVPGAPYPPECSIAICVGTFNGTCEVLNCTVQALYTWVPGFYGSSSSTGSALWSSTSAGSSAASSSGISADLASSRGTATIPVSSSAGHVGSSSSSEDNAGSVSSLTMYRGQASSSSTGTLVWSSGVTLSSSIRVSIVIASAMALVLSTWS